MEFRPGTVLEPSMGIGNFFGLLPESMAGAKLHGVELDPLTGRIAKQLYQNADITIDGFENTGYPDNYFDLAVGNVPFGSYGVHDRRYDRQNLYIHDYFITKTLDKVRPGGIVAFVTTKGTLDKKNSSVRAALARKADLLGAIRLPNSAFKANAGTEVTTDILFFQKRDRAPEKLPEWVETGRTEDGVPLNRYFLQNPEMVLGKMSFWKNMYGNETETACLPIEGADLSQQLAGAIQHIAPPNRELLEVQPGQENGKEIESIPADPAVRNFSFVLSGGKLYFRENSRMNRVELGRAPMERVKGMIAIRDSARALIDLQLRGANDEEIHAEQANLNRLYDQFTKKYGLLNSAGNRLAFRKDSSYPLLCSLEVLDGKGALVRKADMFSKRTIQHHRSVTSTDTAAEALAVSISERAGVDLDYMASLMGGRDKIPQIVADLRGVIFKDPSTGPFDLEAGGPNWDKGWQTADEYLSGDVRRKLTAARAAAETYPEFSVNVEKLEQVQPKDLTAAEIDVHIGAPWVKPEYYRQFLFELLKTPWHLQKGKVDVLYSDASGEWNVKGKSEDKRDNPLIWSTYGAKYRSAYALFEDALNLRDTQIYKTVSVNGEEKRVVDQKRTMIAQQKKEAIGEAFRNWIFKDPERRADLCATYNRLFNAIRPRTYSGEHISFTGMNPEYSLEPHQRNAVARMLYGGNTLLAHCVGAGKTFTMIAACMEGKRLGLCQKSLFVVPNHLTEQWGGDFLKLYPGAKVLVATREDFTPAKRKQFCARIATGDYDAIVMGHTQFEKIPLSPERQKRVIQEQIDEILIAIQEAKLEQAERWSIKQMENTKLKLDAKLKKLNDKKRDDTVTFEELGVDRLFVDEAHYHKNLYMHTKMRNVAGISQIDAQKSSDMFGKCRYLDEITEGHGIVFATGTPISNSMVELYTMMRYLQFEMLKERGLSHFDSWAASFGEKVTAVELKPEGTGFRAKTRFARFYNLPELMSLWKEAADIQTADMLRLPVPEAEYFTISTEPSEAQKAMVQELAVRAEEVRKGTVQPNVDNMLKITSDGRKLALDQRLANPLLPDDPGSKVNACVENVFHIWQESAGTRSTQLIFSDLSTPKGKSEKTSQTGKEDGSDQEPEDEADEETVRLETSVYVDIRDKLIARGVPSEEIAFIHQANTEAQKDELFGKVREGKVRILLGSTQKMGAGTNVQTKLIASHDLDCPWRPADDGRTLRTHIKAETPVRVSPLLQGRM
ncbi:DEAD/DEAH box helicase family protein [Pseudoflavonifractor sp. 524-17]|uniref:DEAD/DEAH box helicase family protein n=1 Tax=Pseudoflavonifractor sp. 524-17 TaxID=2304577 RepID=UPI00325B1EF9